MTRVLEEPTAAALAYGLHRRPDVHHILVYDFGGGTLDVSILHVSDGYVEVIGSEGDEELGGSDFDVLISRYLTEKYAESIVDEAHPKCDTLVPMCTKVDMVTVAEKMKVAMTDVARGE